MKKFNLLVALILCATLLFGCKEPETPITYTLSVNPTSLAFDELGATKELNLESNAEWSIAVSDTVDWLTISPLSGSEDCTISVTAAENANYDNKNTTITFSAPGVESVEVAISQTAKDAPILSISAEETTLLNPSDTTYKFEITSNISWKISTLTQTEDEEIEWLSLSATEGNGDASIEIAVEANGELSSRNVTIIVSAIDADTNDASFTITQNSINSDPDGIIIFEDETILNEIIGYSYHNPSVIDTNNDGALSYSEAAAVIDLRLSSNSIKSFEEIKYFTSLETIDISYNFVDNLDVSYNTKLYKLDCASNYMSYLTANNNPELLYVNCSDNTLEELDLSNSTKLIELDYNNNLIGEAKFENCYETLTRLNCYSNGIENLDLEKFTELTILNCYANVLANIDISHNTKLTSFDCSTNLLTTIDISNNPLIGDFDCRNNQLTELIIDENNYGITGIDCSYNQIPSLDVTQCYTLYTLTCGNQTDNSGNDLTLQLYINAIQQFKNIGSWNTNIDINVTNGPMTASATADYKSIWLTSQMNDYAGKYAVGVAESRLIWELANSLPITLEEALYELMSEQGVDFTTTDDVYVFDTNLSEYDITGWEITPNYVEHVICLIPLTDNGDIDTNIEPTIIYVTTEMTELDLDFTVGIEVVDIIEDEFTVNYTPSNQTTIYNGDVFTTAVLEGYSDEEILFIMPMQTGFMSANKIGDWTQTYKYAPSNTSITVVACGLDVSFTPYTDLFRVDFMSATYAPAAVSAKTYDATKFIEVSKLRQVNIPYKIVEPINATKKLGI